MLIAADAEPAARLRSERNQGRAPDMGWVDHDRLGFNYRLSDVQAAIGVAQLERLDGCSPTAPAPRRCTTSGSRRWITAPGRGRGTPTAWSCHARTAAPSGAAGSSTRCGCRPGPIAMRSSPTSRSAASAPRPICRASTWCPTCASGSAFERGSVPGRRGRIGAAARAPVLPRHHLGPDRPHLRGAGRGAARRLVLGGPFQYAALRSASRSSTVIRRRSVRIVPIARSAASALATASREEAVQPASSSCVIGSEISMPSSTGSPKRSASSAMRAATRPRVCAAANWMKRRRGRESADQARDQRGRNIGRSAGRGTRPRGSPPPPPARAPRRPRPRASVENRELADQLARAAELKHDLPSVRRVRGHLDPATHRIITSAPPRPRASGSLRP